jgi:lipopolysaccharide transport system ATP-binding protein
VSAAGAPVRWLKGQRRQEEHIWALDDVSFEVKQGEVLGIIGRNGAGKSTLLKILSRITKPTRGRVELYGRVGSLLEVGTGFHPELTGRENIYLNGAILGMSRQEIERKFDEIVDFSEIERFLDTPVKFYSNGMYVRLAFAVAAHLEPEILLVDEVLAVGDTAFQSKCLGKMGDVSKQGRTVFFVSHNMSAVEKLCSKAFLIRRGNIVSEGDTDNVIATYLRTASNLSDSLAYTINKRVFDVVGKEDIRFTDISLLSEAKERLENIFTGDNIAIRIFYKANKEFLSPAFVVSIFSNLGDELIRLSTMPISGYHIDHLGRKGYIDLLIRSLPLTAGNYYMNIGFVREGIEWILRQNEAVFFNVTPKDVYGSGLALDRSRGMIVVEHEWKQTILDE